MKAPAPAGPAAPSDTRAADLEFFWDPVCPWAWLTSRWVTDVAVQRNLAVDWRFISLRILNRDKTLAPEYAERAKAGHLRGTRLLRVAAAVRDKEGPASMWDLYTAFGTRIHVDKASDTLDTNEALASILASFGLAEAYAGEADNDAWDADLEASTAMGLSRTGPDVGTPIITFGPPDGGSIFGPVISRAPRGAEALDLFDHVQALVVNPHFAELKRSVRSRPQFD